MNLDGQMEAELEIDFADTIPREQIKFSIQIEETRGCKIARDGDSVSSVVSFTVFPPQTIPDGCGYVEFCQDSYSVQPHQVKKRIRLRRRGSIGRKKRVEIFTRDLTGLLRFTSYREKNLKFFFITFSTFSQLWIA